MILSNITKSILINQNIPFEVVSANDAENLSQIHGSISLLKDSSGVVIAIYNNEHQFELLTLKALIERPKLRFMSTTELDELLNVIELAEFKKTSGSAKNTPQVQLIIDDAMSVQSTILLVTDDPTERIALDVWDIQLMIENILIGGVYSHSDKLKTQLSNGMDKPLLARLENITQLPSMPSLAMDLLALELQPEAPVNELVAIISQDPALTIQILRYANSALFGFSGQIKNLHDAIFRVLGYETVLYMSIGAALGRGLPLPKQGRLSMKNFWQEATFRAALCQQLALQIPIKKRPDLSTTYITGLLHNIGLLFIANVFNTEFNWLNKMLSSRPEQSIIETEEKLLNCNHHQVSEYLLRHWNMHEEIISVATEYCRPNYQAEHKSYVWLSQLAGQLLAEKGLSDSEHNEQAIIILYENLELSEEQVHEALNTILKEQNVLYSMAETLCA
ncbi:MAG: HDOD domain-containing protein [Woeseiaceae bacterium]